MAYDFNEIEEDFSKIDGYFNILKRHYKLLITADSDRCVHADNFMIWGNKLVSSLSLMDERMKNNGRRIIYYYKMTPEQEAFEVAFEERQKKFHDEQNAINEKYVREMLQLRNLEEINSTKN